MIHDAALDLVAASAINFSLWRTPPHQKDFKNSENLPSPPLQEEYTNFPSAISPFLQRWSFPTCYQALTKFGLRMPSVGKRSGQIIASILSWVLRQQAQQYRRNVLDVCFATTKAHCRVLLYAVPCGNDPLWLCDIRTRPQVPKNSSVFRPRLSVANSASPLVTREATAHRETEDEQIIRCAPCALQVIAR